MKKISAAFDGLKYSKSTRDYAITLAKQTNTHLVGVFLDDSLYTSYKIYDLIAKEGVSSKTLKTVEAKDKEMRSQSAEDFQEAAQKAGLEFSVHHDHNIAIQELKHESIYSDLLVIDSAETLNHMAEKPPTRFLRDLLEDVQCPVMVVPHKFKPIQRIILLYDGEPSSVYAIKMFSYLLPQLKHLETIVVSVNPEKASLHMPDNTLMKEFMKRHFPEAKYEVMKGEAEDEIIGYLKQIDENALVVLGAYRRGAVSRWFRESMADVLMKEIKMPLFIAHNK